MYSESDIEAAVAAGALSPEAAASFRATVAAGRSAPMVDEESFRLITGFNDIFVSIAAILLLVAIGWIGSSIGAALLPFDPAAQASYETMTIVNGRHFGAGVAGGAILVALASWALAEYFTRTRRMALTSILLLATFVYGVGIGIGGIANLILPTIDPRIQSLYMATAGLGTAAAAYAHWRRFHVPITVAALTGALVVTVLGLLLAAVPAARDALLWLLLAAGLAIFAFAMWWDISDRARVTRRSDVAFWLHLAAAPMIAHPIFALLGIVGGGESSVAKGLLVLLLYALFGLIALAIDRRALLVSSLFYVLWAMSALFRTFGAISLNLALTGLVIGSALLMLSAFWHPIRHRLVQRLPARWRDSLPALDRVAIPRPA